MHCYILKRSRCDLVCEKDKSGNLRLVLRLANQRSVVLFSALAGLLLAGIYVAILALLEWSLSFLVVALIPVLMSLFGYLVYKAIAPLEIFLFRLDTHTCQATAVSLCSKRSVELSGVTRMEVRILEMAPQVFPVGPHPPLRHVPQALRLVLFYDRGQHQTINVWPFSDGQQLQRAVRAVNRFLAMPPPPPPPPPPPTVPPSLPATPGESSLVRMANHAYVIPSGSGTISTELDDVEKGHGKEGDDEEEEEDDAATAVSRPPSLEPTVVLHWDRTSRNDVQCADV